MFLGFHDNFKLAVHINIVLMKKSLFIDPKLLYIYIVTALLGTFPSRTCGSAVLWFVVLRFCGSAVLRFCGSAVLRFCWGRYPKVQLLYIRVTLCGTNFGRTVLPEEPFFWKNRSSRRTVLPDEQFFR